jgi:putative transcriptional regulator
MIKNKAKPSRSAKALPSVGAEMVGRLKRFTEALQRTDQLGERFTCRTVHLNLRPKAFEPARVKETREMLRASQGVFAEFLGVSRKAVQDWEQGIKPPHGSACRLMDEIRRDPDYWLNRLTELAQPSTGASNRS